MTRRIDNVCYQHSGKQNENIQSVPSAIVLSFFGIYSRENNKSEHSVALLSLRTSNATLNILLLPFPANYSTVAREKKAKLYLFIK